VEVKMNCYYAVAVLKFKHSGRWVTFTLPVLTLATVASNFTSTNAIFYTFLPNLLKSVTPVEDSTDVLILYLYSAVIVYRVSTELEVLSAITYDIAIVPPHITRN
jgi:hypothetical protein